jgi:4-amino-4-deoxy-L-arabinose transferase-like glycosyltransferase
MRPTSDSRWLLAAAFGLLVVVYLGGIQGYPLQDPDEGRYAEIPREMLESGDWVTPRLNYVKYFEKPPLLYWLVAVSFQAFGLGEGAARLPAAASGILTVMVVYLLGVHLFGRRAALLGAAVLATTPIFFGLSQALTTDPLLTACMTLVLASLHAAHVAERKSPWTALAAVCAALAVLSKGLIGVLLPGMAGLGFLLLMRDFTTIRSFLRPLPIGAFLLVALPWFVLVSRANPEFLRFFFIHEHVGRYSASVGHPNGPFYYLPILLLGPLPWSLVGIGFALSREGRRAFGAIALEGRTLLLVWAGVILVFFQLATTKLATYVMPALPALALLLGAWIDRLLPESAVIRTVIRSLGFGMRGLAGFALLAAGAGWLLASKIAPALEIDPEDVSAVAHGAAGAGLALAAAAWLASREALRARGTFAVLLVLVAGLALAELAALPGRAAVKTSRVLARAVAQEIEPGDLLVSYHRYMHGVGFYTGRRLTLVRNYDELRQPAKWAPDREEYFWDEPDRLIREWASGRRVFLVTKRDEIADLSTFLSPEPRLIAEDRQRVLLVNFAAKRMAPRRAPALARMRGRGKRSGWPTSLVPNVVA